MALSVYDQQNLSKEDQAKIALYQAAYKTAEAKKDTAGMTSAHTAAEALRAKSGYSGGKFGSQYNLLPQDQQIKQDTRVPVYTPEAPALRSGQELGNLYGLNYDQSAIENILNKATGAEYAALKAEYDTTANQYYQQMYSAQNIALDTIRKSNASAVATGASRGIQAANELSAILGLEDTASQTATDLANQRNQLALKEQGDMAQNTVLALDKSNQIKQALATLSSNLYATDTQYDVGEMNYYAALNQAAKALEGTQYNADSNLKGVLDTNKTSVKNTNSVNAANKEIAGINKEATIEAATKAADATILAAGISAGATVDAAILTAAGYQNSSGAKVPTAQETLTQAITTKNKPLYILTLTGAGVPIKDAEAYWEAAIGGGPEKKDDEKPGTNNPIAQRIDGAGASLGKGVGQGASDFWNFFFGDPTKVKVTQELSKLLQK